MEFLDFVGMTVALEKALYIVVGNQQKQANIESQTISLTMKGQEIQGI